jgi:endonuclease-3
MEILLKTYGTRPWNWHTRRIPFQVLIGTVLSQRTRDEKTDQAARALFRRYPTAERLAAAEVQEIAELIKPVNYYNIKAARVKQISTIIVEQYAGTIPNTPSKLVRLPGVGRKTAACTLVYGFRKPAIPVDTHVHRVSNRIGLICTQTSEKSEEELWKVVPEEYVLLYNEIMVKHGQSICKPISPLCHKCPIVQCCDHGCRDGKREKG